MKKAYVTPEIEITEFAPNEYVAACATGTEGQYFIPCRSSGRTYGYHGFIVDSADLIAIRSYKDGLKKGQFDITGCSFPGCNMAYDKDQDRKLDDATADLDGYAWIHINWTGTHSGNDEDVALFQTGGSYISNS